jgi:tRNA modification GTPase
MDTIAALATPYGKSALAVIRLSGTNAHSIFCQCVSEASRFVAATANHIAIYTFVHPLNKKQIDVLTGIRYDGPRSYTGDDMVEIICHGGTAIIETILSQFVSLGARLAGPGEFTRRAFANGKMDLLRAEAIAGLSDSISQAGLDSAMYQYRGQGALTIQKLKEMLQEILVELESEIEFPDEKEIQKHSAKQKISKLLSEAEAILSAQLHNRERVKTIEKGLLIVIAGMPNVGKSTIFNSILEYDRSLVHHSRGTTRDFVSDDILFDGRRITLIDTAGIGEAENDVEKMGIERSWENIRTAECVLWISSAENNAILPDEREMIKSRGEKPIFAVINKTDKAKGERLAEYCAEAKIPFCSTSMISNEGKASIKKFLSAQLGRYYGAAQETTLIINERQEAIIREAQKEIHEIRHQQQELAPEILVHHIQKIIFRIQEFSGTITTDQILDDIFSRFCIGK